ncbi:MAG: MFS transporter [Microbacteriaceae bacterium]
MTAARIRSASPWIVILVVAIVSLNLRGPVVAIAPVVDEVQSELGIDAGTAGLLTSLPILCFSLLVPLALLVIRRAGIDAAVTITLVGVGIGTAVRSVDGVGWAITGTVIIGAAITIGNVVVPVVIRRDVPPERVSLTTGVYTSALNVGSAITSLGTAPLAEAFGWQLAVLAWALLAIAALLAWLLYVGPRRALAPAARPARDPSAQPPARARTWGSLTVIMVGIAFSGQAFAYYATTAWVPTILRDETGLDTVSAGASASLFQIAAIIGSLLTPLLLARIRPLGTFVVLGALWSTVPLGLMLAPELWTLWGVLGGAAQGGGFTTVFVVIVSFAVSDKHAAALSGIVQGIGYAVAATAPAVLGFTHDVTGVWSTPLLLVLGAVLTFTGLGVASAVRAARAARRRGSA